MNVVVLVGRLTDNPELRKTNNDISVTRFSIAVDRQFKSGEERQADFINITAWRQTAEFVCKYFRKGSMIAIEGSLQSRSYTDKDGNNRTSYDVIANNVSFTGSKSEGGAAPVAIPQSQDFEVIEEQQDDDLPF